VEPLDVGKRLNECARLADCRIHHFNYYSCTASEIG
jgi:hypothetical protein